MFQDAMFQKLKLYWGYEVMEMKKKIFLRSLLGFPLGLAIGYIITIIISLAFADGYYYPCVPDLITTMGSEINAVLLQTFLFGVLGAGFGAASVIWEIEDWGLIKQTGIYFLISSILIMPIAFVTHWMEHSMKGILSYFGIFLIIFIGIWIIQYSMAKHNVKKMNDILYTKKYNMDE